MTTTARADREDIKMAQERLRLWVRAQMATLSDREMLQVLGGERQHYTPLAGEIAEAEISRRGGREAICQRLAQEEAKAVRYSTEQGKYQQASSTSGLFEWESNFSFDPEDFVLKVFGLLLIVVLGATYMETIALVTVLSFCWHRWGNEIPA